MIDYGMVNEYISQTQWQNFFSVHGNEVKKYYVEAALFSVVVIITVQQTAMYKDNGYNPSIFCKMGRYFETSVVVQEGCDHMEGILTEVGPGPYNCKSRASETGQKSTLSTLNSVYILSRSVVI